MKIIWLHGILLSLIATWPRDENNPITRHLVVFDLWPRDEIIWLHGILLSLIVTWPHDENNLVTLHLVVFDCHNAT